MKAIETKYKGYRFRSRLEARWAVFFDSIGLKWQYEVEGFVLKTGTLYLPDFYLPESGFWIEVKPNPPHLWRDGADKFIEFAKEDDRSLLLTGEPWYGEYDIIRYFDMSNHSKETIDLLFGGEANYYSRHNKWAVDPNNTKKIFVYGAAITAMLHPTCNDQPLNFTYYCDHLFNAFSMARSARFEFGESGQA